jgi:hypothetical protein
MSTPWVIGSHVWCVTLWWPILCVSREAQLNMKLNLLVLKVQREEITMEM